MMSTSAFHWYLAPLSLPNAFDPATSAFEEGLQIFRTKLTTDPKKRAHTLKAAKLQDVLDKVFHAQTLYATRKSKSKTGECILAFSRRVHYYGNIMDVFVQHHPEYAALAWAAMKLVFGAVVEHEKTGVTIVNALCDIADSLPQVELAEILYPTAMMKRNIALLYSYIIKFLLRASAWYETSTVSRALHSLTRPVALRYDDLLQDIQKATSKVNDLAGAGSRAEQRDMHNKLREVQTQQTDLLPQFQARFEEMQRQVEQLTKLVEQSNQGQQSNTRTIEILAQETVLMNRSITASHVDIRQTLSDIQLTQVLTLVSSSYSIDHKATYEYALITRQSHKLRSHAKCVPFWNSPMLQTWDTSTASSSITLKATYRDRLNIRDFSTSLIEQVLKSQVAMLWILKAPESSHNVFEVLKNLIFQALNLNSVRQTDTTLSFHLRNFQAAHSTFNYVNILGEVLEKFNLVYIIIDIDAITSENTDECRQLLKTLSLALTERGAETAMKIMFSGLQTWWASSRARNR